MRRPLSRAAAAAPITTIRVGMTIDNGNHLLLSGNHVGARLSARDRRARIAWSVRRTPSLPFFDLANREQWTLRFNDGRIPWWIFDPRRRVPGTHALDYLSVGRLLWAPRDHAVGEVIRFSGTLYERLLRPLLLAALNIDPAAGSAALAGRRHPGDDRDRRESLPSADRARGIRRDAGRAGA